MPDEPAPEPSGGKHPRGKRSSYAKIPLKARLVFFRKVVHEGGDLRQIARRLNIKYSTAKTLVRNCKPPPEQDNLALVDSLCAEFERRLRPRKRCSYRAIEELTASSQEARSEEEGWSGSGGRGGGGAARIQIICHSLAEQ